MGTIYRGWALAKQGRREEGIGQMRQGLAALRATGAELFRPNYLAYLAETYGQTGQPEEGLNVLVEALAVVRRTEERWYDAEIYRLKRELTLQNLTVISSQLSITDHRPLLPDPQGE